MSSQIEVCIMMDGAGAYVVAADEATVSELAEAELNEDEPQKFVRLKIKLPLPSDDKVSSETFEFELGQ